MKSVLISIQPKWCEKIANGEKTIEVRKTAPKEVPFKCYIYVTKPKKWFRFSSCGYASDECLWLSNGKVKMCNGFEFWADGKEYEPLCCKVIGEFICDRIIEWKYLPDCKYDGEKMYYIDSEDGESTCLLYDEIEEYGKGKTLYGWHISDLKIYDKPKDLGNFIKPCIWDNGREKHNSIENCKYFCGINRPPQSWCYVEELKCR